MVSKQNGRWIQSGIVSWSRGCAEPDLPAVYTRVSQYQTWINSHISSDQPVFITFTSTGTDTDLDVTCPGLPPIETTTTIPPTANTTVHDRANTTSSAPHNSSAPHTPSSFIFLPVTSLSILLSFWY